MVVGEVASLAHAHRVEQSVSVRAGPGSLRPTILSVTRGTHILFDINFFIVKYLCIMFTMGVRTLGDLHHLGKATSSYGYDFVICNWSYFNDLLLSV